MLVRATAPVPPLPTPALCRPCPPADDEADSSDEEKAEESEDEEEWMRKLIAGALLWGDVVWGAGVGAALLAMRPAGAAGLPQCPCTPLLDRYIKPCAGHASLSTPQASFPRATSWWQWITHRYSTRPSGEARLTRSPPAAWPLEHGCSLPAALRRGFVLCNAVACWCSLPQPPLTLSAPPSLPSLALSQALLLH